VDSSPQEIMMMHSCKGPVLSEKKGDLTHKNGGIMRFYGISKQAVVGLGYPQIGNFGRQMRAVYTSKMDQNGRFYPRT
jgi:hypothetical protein